MHRLTRGCERSLRGRHIPHSSLNSWWTELHKGVEAALRYFDVGLIPHFRLGSKVFESDVFGGGWDPLIASCLLPPVMKIMQIPHEK